MVDFAGSNVVVTGGTGALGRAVVAALRAAGAVCHVPNLVAAELDHFPHASDPGVHVTAGVDLADEAAVRRFYQRAPAALGIDPSGRRFCDVADRRDPRQRISSAQFRLNALSCFCAPRRPSPLFAPAGSRVPGGLSGGGSSTSRRGRRSNRASVPAWSPTPPPNPRWRR